MSSGLPYGLWLVGGLALCVAETFAPGAFLIWIGLAGLIVGAVDLVHPLPIEAQILGFAILAAALALVGKRLYGSVIERGGSAPVSRAEAMVGREFYLDRDIVRGFGSIRVGDSIWRVSGPDLPAGTKVKVGAIASGVTLEVEKV